MALFLSNYLPDTDVYSQQQVVAKGLDMHRGEEDRHPFQLVEAADISKILKPRAPFSHKGTYGHVLLIAGAPKTMGAALIAANACLHAGAGLTTVSIPESGLTALNTLLPEVMYTDRKDLQEGKDNPFQKYNSIVIGPGLGTDQISLLNQVLQVVKPILADADALNMMAEDKKLIYKLSPNSILTPHMKEFDRLFGEHKNWWDRLQTAILKSVEFNIVIVLKNKYTFIIDQKGIVSINSTGNPAMAQGGMGDALSGIIAAYVAQGYDAKCAAILGVYFHGKSGDELAKKRYSITASELIKQLSKVVKHHP
ncbi:ADP-dependent NAD(P)H-hydrate dehydratase [Pedobacter sp. UYP24]